MVLHPQAKAALDLWAMERSVAEPGFGAREIAERRRKALGDAAQEAKEPVDRVEDVDADGVRCRLYRPDGSTGTLVFLHGGGFVFGEVDTHDGQARRLANRTGLSVVSVDYRRPPDHPFPAAPDDVDTALAWLLGNAPSVGLDLARGAAIGDSAGGNLAVVAALRNPNVLAATVLVYPFVDPLMRFPSQQAADGGMTAAEAEWYWRAYARDQNDRHDPDLAPIDSSELGGLPPTLVVAAEHDVLLDEDVELAHRMREAGAPVELSTYPGMVHGFWRHPALFDAAEESLAEIAAFLDRVLARDR